MNAHRFMLMTVDNKTGFILATTHKTKEASEINDQIRRNLALIQDQFGRTVKEMRMDQGTEFTNQSLADLLDHKGIIRKFTTTQNHAGNTKAERAIRTTITDVRTLLLQTKMPLRFWKYAIKAAKDVRNFTYQPRITTAPIKLLSINSVKIYLRSFLPFGTPAVV